MNSGGSVASSEFEGAGSRVKTPTEEVVAGLNDLLQLDHDTIGAYEIAIEHLQDREHAQQIEWFKHDHERHIRDLERCIHDLGGTPAEGPHATAPLKRALQRVGAAAGDRALLLAWRTNELEVMAKYDLYAHRALYWPAEVKRVVDENALDEERHYQWVVEVLGGTGEPSEVDRLNRLREGRWQARGPGQGWGARMGWVRDRAADTLEGAAERLQGFSRDAAEPEGGGARWAEGARKAAHALDSTAQQLRQGTSEGSLNEMLEEQLRSSPVRVLATTFAVGVLLGRLIR